jgi:hypothetical protein
MDTGFESRHLYAACRLTFTHYYEPGGQTSDSNGTGFIVGFPEGDSRFGLVTNRHLVDIPWAKPERSDTTLQSIKIEMWQSENFRLEFTLSDLTLYLHNDSSIDVAVIPFGPDLAPHVAGYPYDKLENLIADTTGGIEFKQAISWNSLLKYEGWFSQLLPGEFVTFPGYPIWYDKLQTRPVFRSGMLASDPQTDYRRYEGDPTNHDGNQQILFDAFSTSGNSGSPVFVAQRGLGPLELKVKLRPDDPEPTQWGKTEFAPYHQAFLIGINAGHFNDPDSNRPNEHAGLSRMHKLSAIMEILRANTSPSTEVPRATIVIPKDYVDKQSPPGEVPTKPDELHDH